MNLPLGYDWRQVGSVRDGDTLFLWRADLGYTCVRLAYMDAPELTQGQWGIRARAYLRSLLMEGETVALIPTAIDHHQRQCGEVRRLRDWGNVGLRMVLAGHAACYCCSREQTAYWYAQGAARSKKTGIWSIPGLHQTPWLYR